MPKKTLHDIIHNFSPEGFIHFFRLKNRAFRPYTEPAPEYNDEQFTNALFLGEIPFSTTNRLVIYSFKVNKDLTERSGKKAQYEKGKKILKDKQADAGIFIFYGEKGNFRFSLIYTDYTGTRRKWSFFKRYTYFVSPELTNKTFLKQIGEADFSSIEEIKEAFSVEPVTKEFYNELQNWYFWAMDKIKFPEDYRYSSDPEKDREVRNATNLIRLITRIIFIWFLKEKGLIPPKLFSDTEMKSIVKDFMKDKNSSNYYNAILQNLFFATLNQKMSERRFASEKGYPSNKKEHGVKTLFRYADMFLISKDEALALFKDIPFLNGGLFDCLDKEDEEGKVIYIDGFSRNPRKRAVIPDYLFFQKEEQRVDLSEYGLGTNKTFRGLIEILNSYNFTIDENTPVDQEVALDPELLGKVFENLLASYNPETATTARKATGSYYTPREIVDYMVEESLFEYLNSNLSIPAQGDSNSSDSNLSIPAQGDSNSSDSNLSIPAQELYTFFNPQNEINIYQENLPHWQQKNVWYFVTFRLADSLPAEVVTEIKIEREKWLKKNDKDNLTREQKIEYYRLFSERIERLLDAGKGSCILKEERVAKIIVNALNHFNNKRYILDEWVIMPNHVHVLVKPLNENRLDEILHSWKSFTANEINKLLNRKGQLWMHESYDHIVRNERAFEAIRNYIRQNPEKAGLRLPDYCCSWSNSNRSILVPEQIRSRDASVTLLLSYSEEVPEFTEDEKQRIISAIDRIKILDPACGSGAFPMGVLHKLVHILQRLDPDNRYWYELQYQKALKQSEEVFKQSIAGGLFKQSNTSILAGGLTKQQREERLKEINEAFDESINYPDFARKLYLIENCIYGVDIQPIAIQIAKLRFFISLILDQKVDRTKENLGIRALPNLETKFVSANTLVGLDRPEQMTLASDDIRKLEDEIQALRHRYFQAKTRTEKRRLQKKDRELRQTLAERLESLGFPHDTAEKIAHFDLFDQNASAEWFDPEWMFGVTDGFDIVIGNPPYVRQEKIKPLKPTLKKQSSIYTSTADLYTYFYEKGYEFLRPGGILCFISSNKWLRARYGENLRRFLKENTKVLTLIDFGGYPVFEQTVDTNIILLKKEKPKERHRLKFVNVKGQNINDITSYIKNYQNSLPQKSLSESSWTLADEKVLALKEKIENIGTPLRDWDVNIYFGIKTGFNEAFIIDNETKERLCKEDPKSAEILKPILRGRDIGRYYYRWAGLWLIKIESGWTNKNRGKANPEEFFKKKYPAIYNHLISFKNFKGKGKGLINRDDQGDYWWELRDCSYYPEFEKEKIVWQEIVREPSFAYDSGKLYCEATSFLMTGNSLKYLIALLNSKPVAFFFKQFYAGGGLGEEGYRYKKVFLEKLPIPKIPEPDQKPFIDLVDKILSITMVTQPSRLSNPRSSVTQPSRLSNPRMSNNHKQDAYDTSVKKYERQIDQMVYELYGLTEEEIRIVEGENKNTLS